MKPKVKELNLQMATDENNTINHKMLIEITFTSDEDIALEYLPDWKKAVIKFTEDNFDYDSNNVKEVEFRPNESDEDVYLT